MWPDDLEAYERWRPLLHELGSCEVKHGVRVDVTNLYSDYVGNPQLPKKFQALKKHRSRVRWAEAAIALLVIGAIVAAFFYVSRKPATSLAAIPEKSIAVLPFVNMTADKGQEYFSDGISEELLNLLAKVHELKVTARASAFSFKGKDIGIPEIAKQPSTSPMFTPSASEADQAFAWLDKAIDYKNSGFIVIVVENLFDKIHSDPRLLPSLRKIGKAPDQLAKIQFKVTLPPE